MRLDEEERQEAIDVLNRRLTPKQLRELIDQDIPTFRAIERLVATTERRQGLYSTRLSDVELAPFLVDLQGVDLLQNVDLRLRLAETLTPGALTVLARVEGDAVSKSHARLATKVAKRRWHPGKDWARRFADALGFPKVFAGLIGGAAAPPIEEVEPYVPLPKLHDYQQELVERVHMVLRAPEGQNRALLSLPTGAGKTRTLVEALLTWWGADAAVPPFLVWLAQSDELCAQAVEAFREVWVDQGGRGERRKLHLYRCWGEHSALPGPYDTGGVVVASVQKLLERCDQDAGELRQLARDTAAVVVDEAHHTTAPSYTRVLGAFGITFGQTPVARIPLLGLTATPYRGSDVEENRRLAGRFHHRLLIPTVLGDDPISALRARGILAQVMHRELSTGRLFELSERERQLYNQYGQLPDSFLTRVGEDAQRNALLRQTLLELPADWPVLFFGCSVEHAGALAVLLRRAGRTAAVVTGATRRATRRHLIDQFRQGHIQVLCNYGVLTTGFDAPQIRAVVVARPTTSLVLYEQMIGRGMRGPKNGGTDTCTVIDLADNLARFTDPLAYKRMRAFWS